MQDKELEKILQEKADNVKMRDFSEVWKKIEPELTEQKEERKFFWNKKFSLMLVSAFIIICAALTPIIVNLLTPPPQEVFYTDDLDREVVSVEDMLEDLSLAQITHVDLSRYIITDSYTLITKSQHIKGAEITFIDDEENPSFFAIMKLYDDNVELNVNLEEYDQFIKVNSADVNYKLKQISDGAYDYNVYATCNGVEYLIEYTGLSDSLMQFLNEFFG